MCECVCVEEKGTREGGGQERVLTEQTIYTWINTILMCWNITLLTPDLNDVEFKR